jgi:hypothetical protein
MNLKKYQSLFLKNLLAMDAFSGLLHFITIRLIIPNLLNLQFLVQMQLPQSLQSFVHHLPNQFTLHLLRYSFNALLAKLVFLILGLFQNKNN